MPETGPQTRVQTSAGGVAYRRVDERVEVVLISVGQEERWQLPKGGVDQKETPEQAALREVREEGGVHAELVGPVETIDYWFYAGKPPKRIRIHKFVHFFLMRFLSGEPSDHDHEVNEARWFEIGDAIQSLAFDSERDVVLKARTMIVTDRR